MLPLINIQGNHPRCFYYDSSLLDVKNSFWNDVIVDGQGFDSWRIDKIGDLYSNNNLEPQLCRLNGEPFLFFIKAKGEDVLIIFFEDLQQSQVNETPCLSILLNFKKEIVFCNNQNLLPFTTKIDQWFGENLEDFLSKTNDYELLLDQISELHTAHKICIQSLVRFQLEDSSLTALPIFHEGNNYFYFTIKKIIETEELGERLFLQEKKYNRIIENFQLGLLEVDTEGVILKANPSFSKMSGYSLIELLGRDAGSLLLNDENREMMKSINAKRKEGHSDAYELCIRNKKGEKKWWLISGAPNFDREGNEIGSIGIHWDITAKKELEEQLLFDKNKAEAIAEFKTQFLANMSHEIRTPLNAIVGMIRELKLIASSPQQKDFINVAQIASSTLLSIINDVLDYSKLEAGKLSLENRAFVLSEVIENASLLVSDRIKDKKLDFEYVKPMGEIPVILGDGIRLQQCVLNLLSNATKFTQAGKISVSLKITSEDQKQIMSEITVADTGVGMDPDYLDRVFEKFSQADETISRKFGGSGLGLSITKSLIEMMGGEIRIESIKHHGTTVRIKIPFKKANIETPKIATNESANNCNLKGMRVLVVEDNALNRAVANAFLQRQEVVVTEAHDGIQALEVVSNDTFDLILMDIQMPTIDGIEACKIMRSKGIIIPIVALTANAQQSERVKCQSAGMDDYLVKPFEEFEIIQTLSKFYRKTSKSTFIEVKENENIPTFELTRIRELVGDDPAIVNSIVHLFVREGTRIANEVEKAIEDKDIAVIRARLHELRPNLHNMGMDSALGSLENFRSFIVDDQIVGDGVFHGTQMVGLLQAGIEDMKKHLEESEKN